MGPGLQAETATNRHAARLPGHSVILVAALLLTVVAYIGTLQFQFVYDDLPQIVHNPAVQSWQFAAGYFTHHVWSHVYPTWPGNYYRPVFLLWLLVNWTLFGLQSLGWHLTTVAAHLGVVAMVYWLAHRVTADPMTAAMAALLFGVHPVHLETVAWVSGVSEPLLGLLFIAAFMFYVHARAQSETGRRWFWVAMSLAMFALALLSKETAIVLPGLVAGYEWLREGRGTSSANSHRLRRAVAAVLPFVAVAIGYLLLRSYALKGTVHPDADVTPATVLLTVPSLFWFYARHLVVPAPLSLFYDIGYIMQPASRGFVFPLLFTIGVMAAFWMAARRSRAAAMAILWLLLPLLPPLGSIAVFAAGDIAHDRYLYLPSIGFCILVAMLLRKFTGWRELFGVPAAQIAAVAAIALAFTVGTLMQSVYWANNLLLYHHGVEMAPRNSLARSHLATEMLARGDISAAMRLYHEAYDLNPDAWSTNFILGYTNFTLGHFDEAERYLRRAVEIVPNNANQYLYLGLTLMNLGRLDEAAASARRAVELWDKGAGFHYALGLILQRKGDLAGARDEYRAELKLDPNSAARQQLAAVEAQLAGAPQNR